MSEPNFKVILLPFLFSLLLLFVGAKSHNFWRTISPKSLGRKQEKLSHLHFYFHDVATGPNQTAFQIAEASVTNKSATLFGGTVMIDDPLTVGPEPGSRLVGHAQGLYGFASQDEVALLMVMTFSFVEGKYNGSNLSVLGRNAVFSGVRELPVVGGSGAFRFARGYAQAKTYSFDVEAGNAVVEYDNVKGVFDAAIKVVLQPPSQKTKKKRVGCSIL